MSSSEDKKDLIGFCYITVTQIPYLHEKQRIFQYLICIAFLDLPIGTNLQIVN